MRRFREFLETEEILTGQDASPNAQARVNATASGASERRTEVSPSQVLPEQPLTL